MAGVWVRLSEYLVSDVGRVRGEIEKVPVCGWLGWFLVWLL